MSNVTKKPVFGFATSKDAYRQRTTKALLRLRGYAGWSAPFLFAYCKSSSLMTWLKSSKRQSTCTRVCYTRCSCNTEIIRVRLVLYFKLKCSVITATCNVSFNVPYFGKNWKSIKQKFRVRFMHLCSIKKNKMSRDTTKRVIGSFPLGQT